jgi:hypothetical protein
MRSRRCSSLALEALPTSPSFPEHRKPCRCHRTTVSGRTTCSEWRQFVHSLDRTTQKIRSISVNRGRGLLGFHTASCCRSARFSSANSRCVRRQLLSVAKTIPSHRVMARQIADQYAECKLITSDEFFRRDRQTLVRRLGAHLQGRPPRRRPRHRDGHRGSEPKDYRGTLWSDGLRVPRRIPNGIWHWGVFPILPFEGVTIAARTSTMQELMPSEVPSPPAPASTSCPSPGTSPQRW